ncbi:MAG: hypothetical protein SNF33_07095 [Candidatus Algichlamydia australiensis]|nr:hypothetical protein [Chlamydiales bacterium]
MKVSKKSAIKICFATWFLTGTLLLWKGLRFLSVEVKFLGAKQLPLLRFAARYSRDLEQAILLLIATALIVGFIKGRIALRGVVNRTIARMNDKVQLQSVFAPRELILIGFMIALGVSMRFLPIPIDVRGFVDVAIGSGLMNGAMLFLRKLIYDKAGQS